MTCQVAPFEVRDWTLGEPVRCRFVHLHSAIATRHSDTVDCVFLVNGHKLTVAISCAALAHLRQDENVTFSDQQLAEMAARHLRKRLEEGYNPAWSEIVIDEAELRALGREMGYL